MVLKYPVKTHLFTLIGHFGENNVGDDILLLSLINGLRDNFNDCKIYIVTANTDNTRNLLLRESVPLSSLDFIYSGRWGLINRSKGVFSSFSWIFKTLYITSKSSLVIIGPGSVITDSTNPLFILFYLVKIIIPFLFRHPYAFVGIGTGDMNNQFNKILIKAFANRAVLISTRDEESARDLKELGVIESKIFTLADLSFYSRN